MRWVPLPGVLGAAIGAIVTGTVATLRSTTIIITIATTISTAMSAARDKVIGNTIRNTAEMHRMGTGKQPISLAVRARVGQVAPVVPAVRVALVVSEDPVEPAVQESPAVPVAPERELVQVEAVPAREHPRVRAAVPLRTKSVITPHHRGLVPLLGAEDLAAEVETTREPAVAEAVIAWEVAE